MATSDEATHPPSHHVNNDTMKQKQLIIIILQKCLDSNDFCKPSSAAIAVLML